MKIRQTGKSRARQVMTFCTLLCWLPAFASAQDPRGYAGAAPQFVEQIVGPFNVHALEGGAEFKRAVPAASRMLLPEAEYTLSLWFRMDPEGERSTLIAGLGNPEQQDSRFLGLRDGRPVLRVGRGLTISAQNALAPGVWHLLAASVDGPKARLYADGKLVAEGEMAMGKLAAELLVAPADDEARQLAREGYAHFGGYVAGLKLDPGAHDAATARPPAEHAPDTALLRFDEASPAWPVQVRGQAGYTGQQDPSLLPVSRAAPAKGMAKPLLPLAHSALRQESGNAWAIAENWFLASAPAVHASPAELSAPGFAHKDWMRATIPGTVLTTMVDRGLYPDPDIGLNNMSIPESLARQDYWYRVEFASPRTPAKHMELVFEGINYAAEVWLNGARLGGLKGAFVRGRFDVTAALRRDGNNALAVRVSPPPHPGIPQEQSLEGGPGENGGAMVMDGPTFSATEGWDWIPAIRDRNTGIWQDVRLIARDDLRLGDAQVITRLALPDTTSADVEITVPVWNDSDKPTQAEVRAQFEGVEVRKQTLLPVGRSIVKLEEKDFPQLHITKPRLWWPNGYGSPELYRLRVSVSAGAGESDHRESTFGIREVTYELSLFDSKGRLRRVEVSPTEAHRLNQQVVDVRHESMLRRQAEFAAASLTSEGETSAAVKALPNDDGLTDLVLKVNGVRIAARGGNWGMDDSRKRVGREHLEPYFRLHREAHLNIIRNWMGQNTEEMFYQLADEYGLMVWNDFWESTQDYNTEAQDIPLFLDNARDTVRRFRNHPSIVMWCGRNEGVPQPLLNQGLIDLLHEEDGTRYYTPSSNRVNLRNSGPYSYQTPATYYTIDKGFSVELGTASLATLENLQTTIAREDQWPMSDAWAYHDWHWSGNGDIHPFLDALDRQLGAGTDLKDFERKAQMFNYVDHRAIFEGFNQHLWQPNSGRLLWMTQPAWPSNMWQIFSSDFDTNASYYGVKKACEPFHIQLDLGTFAVAAINTTREEAGRVSLHAAVLSLGNVTLFTQDAAMDLHANSALPSFTLPLGPLFASEGVVLVKLTMKNAAGEVLSENTYWLAGDETEYRRLNGLKSARLTATARSRRDGSETVIDLQLSNQGSVPALEAKATLTRRGGERILPSYYSDNYVTVLPGETKTITLRYPTALGSSGSHVLLRGWNVGEADVNVP